MAEKKTCYVICPIGDPGSDVRKRSDTVLEYIVTPAVAECGYKKPIRSDIDQQSDMITPGIIRHLFEDDLVIADLTGPNANVFYELGIRHMRRKATIHLIQEGQEPPFDTKDLRAIPVDVDIAVAKTATDAIKERIRSIEKDPESAASPVKFLITLIQAEKLLAGPSDTTGGVNQVLRELLKLMTDNRAALQEIKADRIASLTDQEIASEFAARAVHADAKNNGSHIFEMFGDTLKKGKG